jgi:hypothetical protein
MDSPLGSRARWAGDPNAEWMNLAVEVAEIGTWEFDLNQAPVSSRNDARK